MPDTTDPSAEHAVAIAVVEHDPAWARQYEAIAAGIFAANAGHPGLLRVEHAGSTSVPGLAAKPIVDVLALVRSFDEAAAVLVPRLEGAGYVFQGEFGIPGRHYLRYHVPSTRHVHIYEATHPEARKVLLFRDYLRSHPEVAAEYATLKRRLATEHPFDRPVYTALKGPFIEGVLRAAGWRAVAAAGAGIGVR